MSLVDGGYAELVLTHAVNLLPETEPHDDKVESMDRRVVQTRRRRGCVLGEQGIAVASIAGHVLQCHDNRHSPHVCKRLPEVTSLTRGKLLHTSSRVGSSLAHLLLPSLAPGGCDCVRCLCVATTNRYTGCRSNCERGCCCYCHGCRPRF